jgi:hypothetical protein
MEEEEEEEAAPAYAGGGIFISYRRDDGAYPAGWLAERLMAQYGRDRVFWDVGSGQGFEQVIVQAARSSVVMLVIIGLRWLVSTDGKGNRRADGPGDFVQLEIEAALSQGVRIIPVLVDGAAMPMYEQLPRSLTELVRRQAFVFSPDQMSAAADELILVLDRILRAPGSATAPDSEELTARLDTAVSPQAAMLLDRLTLVERTWAEPGLAATLIEASQEQTQDVLSELVSLGFLVRSRDGNVSFADEAVRAEAALRLAEDEDEPTRERIRKQIRRWDALNHLYEPQARLARDYWTVDDLLGYRPYARAIAGFIRHRETLPPLTIGIKAPWGAGKTSLMRMIQQELDPPTGSPGSPGPPRQIQLRERERLTGRRRLLRKPGKVPAETSRVTNGELLSRATPPSGPLRAGVAADDGPLITGEWRPTVWFNPWMYQSGEQVWAGFAHEIIHQVTSRLPVGDRERFWLALNYSRLDREAVRRRAYKILVERLLPLLLALVVVLLLAAAAAGLASLFKGTAFLWRVLGAGGFSLGVLGFSAGLLTRTVRFFRESASDVFPLAVKEPQLLGRIDRAAAGQLDGAYDALVKNPGYDARLGFLHLVQSDIARVLDLVATPEQPVVIFVDDLDRCSPSTVAQVIEAINLFLAGEFPNCIFILAMEPAVVAAHVEANYKDLVAALEKGHAPGDWSTLGWKFLEKIVQLPVSLPAPDPEAGIVSYVRDLVGWTEPPEAGQDSAAAAAGASPASGDSQGPRPATAEPAARGPASGGQLPFDPVLSGRIEAAILLREPTLDNLPVIAREVQARLLGIPDSDSFRPETRRAMDRIFASLYSDRDAYQAIEVALPALDSDNPREIKRYVNLFRFYMFIRYQQRSPGDPAPSGDEIAKLAALAIRWPQWLTTFTSGSGARNPLHILECAARASAASGASGDGAAGAPDAMATWAAALTETGFTEPARYEDLRRFLSSGPEIGDTAGRLL